MAEDPEDPEDHKNDTIGAWLGFGGFGLVTLGQIALAVYYLYRHFFP